MDQCAITECAHPADPDCRVVLEIYAPDHGDSMQDRYLQAFPTRHEILVCQCHHKAMSGERLPVSLALGGE